MRLTVGRVHSVVGSSARSGPALGCAWLAAREARTRKSLVGGSATLVGVSFIGWCFQKSSNLQASLVIVGLTYRVHSGLVSPLIVETIISLDFKEDLNRILLVQQEILDRFPNGIEILQWNDLYWIIVDTPSPGSSKHRGAMLCRYLALHISPIG